jgi:hypothetical protein
MTTMTTDTVLVPRWALDYVLRYANLRDLGPGMDRAVDKLHHALNTTTIAYNPEPDWGPGIAESRRAQDAAREIRARWNEDDGA